jgi:hypothetical protein
VDSASGVMAEIGVVAIPTASSAVVIGQPKEKVRTIGQKAQ